MKISKKTVHIIIIIAGIIFVSLSAFHSSLWFDESYSVALAKHSFAEIWNITGNDVHPALYYWMLHIIYLVFGNKIIAFRLFSVIATAILGIIGYTHIRKDFGEKTGILFSFLVYFLPVMTAYSQEIRMYSWASLFVTLTAIYAYRFYKNIKNNEENGKLKNLIIFGICSIACCYIHYYALVTTCLINLLLLIFVIRNRKNDKKSLIRFLILAGIQILLYIPWLIYLFGQINHVTNGFWINIDKVSTPIEFLSFQFRRQLDTNFTFDAHTIIALIASVLLYIYLGVRTYKYKKEKVDIKPAYLSLFIYVGVVIIMLLASLVLMQALFFSRYLFVMTGLYIFWIAYLLSKEQKKAVLYVICAVILILGTISNIVNINLYYNEENTEIYNYISEYIEEGDIIVYSNIGNGGVVAALFPEYEQYFLCDPSWDVKEAYEAYGPGMETLYNLEDGSHDWSFLEDYTGRIWLIDSENMGLWEEFPKDGITILMDTNVITTTYHEYIYSVMLLEKN